MRNKKFKYPIRNAKGTFSGWKQVSPNGNSNLPEKQLPQEEVSM